LVITRKLAQQDASSAQAQRGVAGSLGRIGDILRVQNNLAGAMARYQEELVIARKLALQDASSAQAQRSVSVSLDRIGDILRAQNDLTGAMARYEEGLVIARKLAMQGASSAQAQRGVLVSLWKMAIMGSPEYDWRSVVVQLEYMQQRNMIAPGEQHLLGLAREQQAAEEARR